MKILRTRIPEVIEIIQRKEGIILLLGPEDVWTHRYIYAYNYE